MKSTIIFIFLLTNVVYGQPVDLKVNDGKTNIYSDAIVHFIDTLNNRDNLQFDTLFVLKNSGEFMLPGNSIESIIQKTNIVLKDTTTIGNHLKYSKSLNVINLFADQNLKDHIELLINYFIVSQDKTKINYKPIQYCTVAYDYNTIKKEFVFDKILFGHY